MKLHFTFAYHYMLFFGIALLLAKPTFICPFLNTKEVKIEKLAKQKGEETVEVLHSEMLLRY